MAHTPTKYQKFWAGKTSAMGRGTTMEFYNLVAEEIRLLCGGQIPRKVLELGCGTGLLYRAIEVAPEDYLGVDFSGSMLGIFQGRHPEVHLIETEASEYVDERRTYDLIFSHDVVAHFSPAMLDRHFQNARKMMHPGSLLICAAIPWKELRRGYDRGFWFAGVKPSWGRWAKDKVRRLMGKGIMGRWYRPDEVRRIAAKNGLQSKFHGSLSHPYRFHAVLWKGGRESISEMRPTGKP
ncbi:MAG TPA: class I SAM-dependent methyltransferase [Candidatus Acidoferrales bacterium]|nr:class I SAM-dependent methyltransferase [Candidatus Acidoferrales bacterium]